MTNRLPAWSLFAALIAMAGLPIYIHAPKFYVDQYGTSLAAMGLTLAALRLIDVVQDPLLGWLAEATRPIRRLTIALATTLMAAALTALFAVTPPIAPLAWFALTLTLLFSAFSYLTICFYAEGVTKAQTLGPQGHIRLAGWREAGSLLGVCLAATAPVALAPLTTHPFTAFALIFAASGAALGADLTLLPAIFAQRLAQTGTPEAAAFGLWNFVSKLSLALAALTILPALQAAGFQLGAQNTESALVTLTLIYAGLPCVLKLTAIALLARTTLAMPLKDAPR